MSDNLNTPAAGNPSRREFLRTSGAAVVGGTLAAQLSFARQAHAAASDDTIRVALIGSGSRGGGAAGQALATGNVKLVAMADAFQYRLDDTLSKLNRAEGNKGKIDVPKERQFTGFDAYQRAIDADVDLVILATPPGFRPIHYEAAVKAGKHVFMEKPVAVDVPGIRQVMAATEEAKKKNLAVGVGFQRHHQLGYLETIKRLQDGAIGDMVAARVYWNGTRPWKRTREDVRGAKHLNKPDVSEMEYQMVNWYYFVWLCGDHNVEQHIHNIDVINWLKGEHPIKASGMGGSQIARTSDDGDIFDHHFVEYEFKDGSRMYSQCRHMVGCTPNISEHVHGTKGTSAINAYEIRPTGGEMWKHRGRTDKNPYQVEHDDLFAAIRSGTSYNEADNGIASTMTAILGRLATYSGKEVTWEDAMKSEISVMPSEFAWTAKPPVVWSGKDGLYPQAIPGISKVV